MKTEKVKIRKKLENMLNSANAELERQFGFKIDFPKIVIAHNRAEYNKIIGRTTELWTIGEIVDDKTLLILSPDSWKTDAPMYDFDEISDGLVKHELVHLYIDYYYRRQKFDCPHWLGEGLAVCLSGQLAQKNKNKENFINFFDLVNRDGSTLNWPRLVDSKIRPYDVAGFFVEYCLKKMSLFEFLRFIQDNKGKIPSELIDDFINVSFT